MIAGAIRTFAVVACAFATLGFVLFAVDQAGDASSRQVSAIVDPSGSQARQRAAAHSPSRRLIDRVDDRLLAPFDITSSSSDWVRRGVPTALALLVYGLGLGYLARAISART